jgi:hypothetical protein
MLTWTLVAVAALVLVEEADRVSDLVDGCCWTRPGKAEDDLAPALAPDRAQPVLGLRLAEELPGPELDEVVAARALADALHEPQVAGSLHLADRLAQPAHVRELRVHRERHDTALPAAGRVPGTTGHGPSSFSSVAARPQAAAEALPVDARRG